MFPDHVLSSQNFSGTFLIPDGLTPTRTKDYELGGIALNDPTQGLMVQTWTLTLRVNLETLMGSVWIEAEAVPETLLFERVGITEVSLAFDQNMHPFVAFEQSGQAWFWWFDTQDGTQKFTQLPIGARSPKCCLDDKRALQSGTSDILLVYLLAGTLYLREQRDRFTVDYTLKTGITEDIIQIGMNNVNRVQIAIGLYDE